MNQERDESVTQLPVKAKEPEHVFTEEQKAKYHPGAFKPGFNRKTRRHFGLTNFNFTRRTFKGKPTNVASLEFRKSLMELYINNRDGKS